MKLLRVLVLVALPLYCFAGSGCQLLEDVVDKTISPHVNSTEYQNYLHNYVQDSQEHQALAELKQCFLNQSNKTLTDFGQMMQIMYFSPLCDNY